MARFERVLKLGRQNFALTSADFGLLGMGAPPNHTSGDYLDGFFTDVLVRNN